MLHGSPLCTGIAHERDNVFWAFDGMNGHIVRYDFMRSHEPGGSKHNDGRIRRYPEATITRVEGRTSQLAFDYGRAQLYVADTGGNRLMRLDAREDIPVAKATEPPALESLAEYGQVTGMAWERVAAVDLPVGLVIRNDEILVASGATNDIVIFDRSGQELRRVATGASSIAGMTVGPDGKVYFVDQVANTVTRIDP
jgi:sugar lactone lactonase YvrE